MSLQLRVRLQQQPPPPPPPRVAVPREGAHIGTLRLHEF